jgi:hypothetical protein
MDWRSKRALEAFAGGAAPAPQGVAGVTLSNLLHKHWIVRTERIENFGPELYVLTDAGRAALNAEIEKKEQISN